MPPIVKPDGCITHSSLEKATLFADVFDSKQSNEKLDIPLSCFPEPKLTSFAFQSSEVKKLCFTSILLKLLEPNGIFFFFFFFFK